MENGLKIVFTAAAGIVAALFLVLGLVPRSRTASWYHKDKYHYYETDDEFTYTSPVHRTHIRFDKDSGLEYVDNELIIQLRSSFPEDTARKIATDRDAEMIGYSSVSGTCQWKLNKSMSLDELHDKTESLMEDSEIEGAYINQVMTLCEPAAKSVFKSWEESSKGWGYTAIGASSVRDYDDDIKKGINVGILDAGFQKHEDLSYTFDGGSNDEDDGDHGAFVAGLICAECIGDDECGVEGVYSRIKHRGDVFGRCWKDPETHRTLPLSGMLHELSVLLLEDCKVINISFAYKPEAAYSIMTEPDEELARTHRETAKLCELFLNGYIQKGYEFLIVQAAGNTTLRKSTSSFRKNKNIKRGSFLYELKEEEDDKDKKDDDEDETEDPENLSTEILKPEDSSPFAAIENKTVSEHVIVAGGFDRQFQIYSEGSSGSRIDLMAPAVGIYSTRNRMLVSQDGTSAAAAYVSGALASMWSLKPSTKASKVRDYLMEACTGSLRQDITDPQTQTAKPMLNVSACMQVMKSHIEG